MKIMQLNIDSLRTSEQEVTGYYLECHGPGSRASEDINAWVTRMINMLGMDDCKFLIKSRQPHLRRLWMTETHYLFEPCVADAKHFEWGEAAVKITNNPKLEAIRIVSETEAVGSDGTSYRVFKRSVPPKIEPPVVSTMPVEYHGRWDINHDAIDRDNDRDSIADFGDNGGYAGGGFMGQMGQNGELFPE